MRRHPPIAIQKPPRKQIVPLMRIGAPFDDGAIVSRQRTLGWNAFCSQLGSAQQLARRQHADVADVARAGDDTNHPVAGPQRLRSLAERRADYLKHIVQQMPLPLSPQCQAKQIRGRKPARGHVVAQPF